MNSVWYRAFRLPGGGHGIPVGYVLLMGASFVLSVVMFALSSKYGGDSTDIYGDLSFAFALFGFLGPPFFLPPLVLWLKEFHWSHAQTVNVRCPICATKHSINTFTVRSVAKSRGISGNARGFMWECERCNAGLDPQVYRSLVYSHAHAEHLQDLEFKERASEYNKALREKE